MKTEKENLYEYYLPNGFVEVNMIEQYRSRAMRKLN